MKIEQRWNELSSFVLWFLFFKCQLIECEYKAQLVNQNKVSKHAYRAEYDLIDLAFGLSWVVVQVDFEQFYSEAKSLEPQNKQE